MLENTFLLVDGIGPTREAALWRSGITTWQEFIREPKIPRISEHRKEGMDAQLAEAVKHLSDRDGEYFASKVASSEHWRCLDEFSSGAAFLDIETTGVHLSSPITVVGVYDGRHMHELVRGRDLTASNLKAVLDSASMFVTFNGSSFDLPMLRRHFPGCIPPVPHVDLKHPLRRLGLTGGLKAIERELGIERDKRVEYMTGEDAVYLWRLWERHGRRNALDLLTEYNAEDCRNLRTLAEYAYLRLRDRTLGRARRFGES